MKRIYYTLFLIVLGMAEMNAQRQQSEEGQSRSSRFGRQMDANGDGKISREEFPGPKETFDQFDKDKDNFLSNDERNAMRQSRGRNGFGGRGNQGGGFRRPNQGGGSDLSEQLFKAIDDNNDKNISSKEWQNYFDEILSEADKDKDKTISDEEWKAWRQRKQSSSRPGGRGNGPNVGDPAPEVSAQFMNKKDSLEFNKITRLSVIIFGSYTWGPFSREAGSLQKVYETYGKKADFYWVYIREAHPLGSSRPSPLKIEQPKTFSEREEVAQSCQAGLNLSVPLLVDDIKDTVSRAFDAMPDRMYIIGKDGRIAYKGGRGPREFDVSEMERELKKLIDSKWRH